MLASRAAVIVSTTGVAAAVGGQYVRLDRGERWRTDEGKRRFLPVAVLAFKSASRTGHV
jgi:hypothetical protein